MIDLHLKLTPFSLDLSETVQDVETHKVYDDNGRRYLVYRGTTHESRKVVIIWRETKGWTQKDYERGTAVVAEQKMAEGIEEILVNGDSYIQGARSLDGLFKARMFSQTEA